MPDGSQDDGGRPYERLIALFLAGVVLFHPLFIRVFDLGADVFVFGIPVLFVSVFASWAALIAGVALVIEVRSAAPADDTRPGPPSGPT